MSAPMSARKQPLNYPSQQPEIESAIAKQLVAIGTSQHTTVDFQSGVNMSTVSQCL